MGLLTSRQLLDSGLCLWEAHQMHIMWNIASKRLRCLFFYYDHHGKRLLAPIGGNEWNNDLKRLLGQVGKLHSTTTSKLASWNVHEQSFLVGRVLEIKQEQAANFWEPAPYPRPNPPVPQGVRRTPFEKPWIKVRVAERGRRSRGGHLCFVWCALLLLLFLFWATMCMIAIRSKYMCK